MPYSHTQYGYLHWVIGSPFVFCTAIGIWQWMNGDTQHAWPMLAVAVLAAIMSQGFRQLTITDEGDRLLLAYGPLPFGWKRLKYEGLRSAEAGRTTFFDGWGMHYRLGRGWTYNLWGRDCVVLRYRWTTVRVGTDDVAGLLAMVQSKIEA
jgi:hypothetical protein